MKTRFSSVKLILAALVSMTAGLACGKDATAPRRAVTTVVVAVGQEIEVAQRDTAIALVLDESGLPLNAGPVTWSSSFPEVAVVSPTTGEILAIAPGTTQIGATVAGKVGRRTLTVSSPPTLIVEVNSGRRFDRPVVTVVSLALQIHYT